MKLNKDQVLEFIRARGDDEHAAAAERELPESISLPEDEGLLARYGVTSEDLGDESVWGV